MIDAIVSLLQPARGADILEIDEVSDVLHDERATRFFRKLHLFLRNEARDANVDLMYSYAPIMFEFLDEVTEVFGQTPSFSCCDEGAECDVIVSTHTSMIRGIWHMRETVVLLEEVSDGRYVFTEPDDVERLASIDRRHADDLVFNPVLKCDNDIGCCSWHDSSGEGNVRENVCNLVLGMRSDQSIDIRLRQELLLQHPDASVAVGKINRAHAVKRREADEISVIGRSS